LNIDFKKQKKKIGFGYFLGLDFGFFGFLDFFWVWILDFLDFWIFFGFWVSHPNPIQKPNFFWVRTSAWVLYQRHTVNEKQIMKTISNKSDLIIYVYIILHACKTLLKLKKT
jgi:hypothetical protein